jgi:hypothetical protein
MEQLKKCLYDRMSRNWVGVFLEVPSLYRDDFMQHYYDTYAQVIFYGLSAAYPSSAALIEAEEFKIDLVTFCSMWTIGFRPGDFCTKHWKILKKEPKKNTFLQKALAFSTKTKTWDLEKKMDQEAMKFRRKYHPSSSSSHAYYGGSSSSSNADKDVDSHDDTDGGSSSSSASSSSSSSSSSTSSSSSGSSGGVGGSNSSGSNSSIGGNPSTSLSSIGDDKLDRKGFLSVKHALLPYLVVKKVTDFHHSGFIQHFLECQGYSKQMNRKFTVPLSTMLTSDEDVVGIYNERMKTLNEQTKVSRASRIKLAEVKREFNKLSVREQKLFDEQDQLIKIAKHRAEREPSQFTKGLVKEQMEKRQQDMENLRRPGQYQRGKEEHAKNAADEIFELNVMTSIRQY